jgi:transcriptional regulator with XRE-family HTH domain
MMPFYELTEEERRVYNARFLMEAWAELVQAFRVREAQGGTRQALADAMGIDKSVVSRRLNGSSNLTLEVVSEMARAMGYRPELRLQPYETMSAGNDIPTARHKLVVNTASNSPTYKSVQFSSTHDKVAA